VPRAARTRALWTNDPAAVRPAARPPRRRRRSIGHEPARTSPIKRPQPLPRRAGPPNLCAEPTAIGQVRRRRGTRVSGRSHRRTTHSRPPLVPTRTTTPSSRTTSPHPTPELEPQRLPLLGAAARSATGHLHSQLRPKSVPSNP
jgi:hypothetical protein